MRDIPNRRGRQATWAAIAMGLWLAGGVVEAQTAAGYRSTQPAQRIEYWQKRLNQISARLAQPESLAPVKLLFLGDSITDFWTLAENPWFPGKMGGLAVWNETFGGSDPEHLALNFGISGDRTEHVLYRIQPASEGGLGELDRADLNPDVVVLLIGINNSWDAESPAVDSVVAGIRAVVAAVHARKPDAKIVLQSLLPTNEPARNADLVLPVNAALAAFAAAPPQADYIHYLNLYPSLLNAQGLQNPGLFMDGVHPNESGYRAWREQLLAVLDQLRAD